MKSKLDEHDFIDWFDDHKDECSTTHEGSAGKMEVDAIVEIFSRSEEKFKVKYIDYIGDSDSKTFKSILNLNPYGNNFPVIKSECVGHVEKRMGTRLRRIKKKEKLARKHRLTDVIIRKLTIFYGSAIRRNSNSVPNIKKAIMFSLNHYCSPDKPRNEDCLAGADSWCKWQKAKATNLLVLRLYHLTSRSIFYPFTKILLKKSYLQDI